MSRCPTPKQKSGAAAIAAGYASAAPRTAQLGPVAKANIERSSSDHNAPFRTSLASATILYIHTTFLCLLRAHFTTATAQARTTGMFQ